MKLLPALAALLLAAPASAQLDPDAEVPRAAAAPAPGGAPCITAGPKGPEVLALPVDGTERSAMIAARCPLPLSGLAFPKEDLKNLPKNCPGTLGPLFHPEGRYDTLESVSAYIAKGIAAERFGKIAVHATPHTQFCGEKEGSRKDDSRYFAGAAKDHINLGLAVRVQARLALESQLGDRDLAARHEPYRMAELFNGLARCVDRIETHWKRYGVNFDLQLYFAKKGEPPPGDSPYPWVSVELLDWYGRADSSHWEFGGQRRNDGGVCIDKCMRDFMPADRPDDAEPEIFMRCVQRCGLTQIGGEFCYTVMHETLHLLNLDDEYPDKACPGRAFIAPETDPASFMDGSKGGPSFVLMPRHMLRILRPLCL